MAYAPVRGELPAVSLRPPIRTALNESVWHDSGRAATAFWQRVAADREVSAGFRKLARENARREV